MATVMLQGKEPNEQGTSRNAKQKGKPHRMLFGPEHEANDNKKWNSRGYKLEDCAAVIGFPVLVAIDS